MNLATSDGAALEAAARLFAELLLCEVDAARLAELRQPEVATALAAVGVDVTGDVDLDELAAEYFETFVNPNKGAPPVASLWTSGEYEADAARALRELAKAAALDFDRDAARGAPVDHLGSILLLWCSARERAPEVADRIARDHLAWVDRALAPVRGRAGFYGAVTSATAACVEAIRARL